MKINRKHEKDDNISKERKNQSSIKLKRNVKTYIGTMDKESTSKRNKNYIKIRMEEMTIRARIGKINTCLIHGDRKTTLWNTGEGNPKKENKNCIEIKMKSVKKMTMNKKTRNLSVFNSQGS